MDATGSFVDPVEEFALHMFKRLREFHGGRVPVTVSVPHKCPMAPLEITFMLYDYFKDRGILDKTQIQYAYPIGRTHSLENVAKWAIPEFDRLGIGYQTLFNMKEVDGKNKAVHTEEGTEAPYDLLICIRAHKGMEGIEKNGLGKGSWIPTDRRRLNMEGRDNVFVLGDTTNLPISKAGSTAHFEAGKDRATYAMFNYQTPASPKPPSKAVHWFKTAYNRVYRASARGLL